MNSEETLPYALLNLFSMMHNGLCSTITLKGVSWSGTIIISIKNIYIYYQLEDKFRTFAILFHFIHFTSHFLYKWSLSTAQQFHSQILEKYLDIWGLFINFEEYLIKIFCG